MITCPTLIGQTMIYYPIINYSSININNMVNNAISFNTAPWVSFIIDESMGIGIIATIDENISLEVKMTKFL